MAPAMDLALGTILSGTYKITNKLGEGGMGSVYGADHQRLPRPYAIKVLHEAVQTDSEFYHRFRREAEICSRLRHENIVEVMDFNFTPDGRPYIAMELLDGEDLESRLESVGRLTAVETLGIVAQVAAGLAVAHEQGVIHRDLKPQNIFLCKRRDGGDLVKIVDFGISKIQGSVSMLTADFALLGTPYYMSPEQTGAGDGKVTVRSDIYALGVIAYQMLSGDLPIVGESLAKIVLSINTKRPQPLRQLVPELSPAVEAVVDVALAKDPLQRFGSVADFHEALRRAVEHGDLTGLTSNGSVAATVQAGAARAQVTPPAGALDGHQSQPTAEPSALGATSTYNEQAFRGAAIGNESAVSANAEPGVANTTLSSAAAETQMTTDLPRPASERGKWVAVVGVIALLLVGGGVWYAYNGGRDGGSTNTSEPSTTTSEQSPGKNMTATAARATPSSMERIKPGSARVVIRLKGLPAGARCTVEGKVVEGNPLVIPRGRLAVRLACTAKGYAPRSTDLIPDRDRTIGLTLEPQRAATSVTRRRPRVRSMRRRRRRTVPMRPMSRRRARPIDSDIPIE